MGTILRNIAFIALIFTSTLAIPTIDPNLVPSSDFYQSVSPRTCVNRSPWKHLKDSLIEKIWRVPKKPQCQTSNTAIPTDLHDRYGRDAVLRFNISLEEEMVALSEAAKIFHLDIWDSSSNWVDLRIKKDMISALIEAVPPSLQRSYTPLIYDLTRAVYETYPATNLRETWRVRQSVSHKIPRDPYFDDFQPMSVVDPWLRLLAGFFPGHAEYFSIGTSVEGREIPAIRIGDSQTKNDPAQEDKPRETILIVGGSHAREWISVSTVSYMAHVFALRYGKSHYPVVNKILRNFDIIFIPVLNPDGYEYTWTTDRLWRKNRQQTNLPFCPGIDVDRAFSFQWDGHDDIDNPCTDAFAGEHAFQAVEAKALADWARNQTVSGKVTFVSYLDMHSYSQKVLYPYSHSCEVAPPNLEDLEEVALGLAKSFRLTTGNYYGVDSACEGALAASASDSTVTPKTFKMQVENGGGSSLDWFYHDLGVKWSYQIKLRDTGTYGFLLPPENILPAGHETLEAVLGLGELLLSNRGIEGLDNDRVQDDDQDLTVQDIEPTEFWSKKQGNVQTESIDHDDDDGDEWERVYDEELRRRRRR